MRIVRCHAWAAFSLGYGRGATVHMHLRGMYQKNGRRGERVWTTAWSDASRGIAIEICALVPICYTGSFSIKSPSLESFVSCT